jgi:uncharacterized protein YndB with AHSA1/START domain
MATTKADSTLRISRIIKAPRAKVYAAWTTPEEMKKWCAPGEMTCTLAESDVKVGGKLRVHMSAPGPNGETHKAVGEYRSIEIPSKLVYTWSWETPEGPSPETIITMEFVEHGPNKTEVIMLHELPNEEAMNQHEKGWLGCFAMFETLFAA